VATPREAGFFMPPEWAARVGPSAQGVVGLLAAHFARRTTQVTTAPPQMTTGSPIAIQSGAFSQLHTATTMATHMTRPPTSRMAFFIVPPSCQVPP